MTQLHDLRVTAASAGTQGGSVENLKEREVLVGRAQISFTVAKLLDVILCWWIYVITLLSKLIQNTIPRVNPNVNYKL